MENNLNIYNVEDMIYNLDASAHLKDAITGKYLASNTVNIRNLGLQNPADIYGLTILDLKGDHDPLWRDIQEKIIVLDNLLLEKGQPVVDSNRVRLINSGLLYIHHLKKIPVKNSKGGISAIFTVNQDITYQLSVLDLLSLYKNTYNKNKAIAITNFLKHINVFALFNLLPTEQELMVLLYRVEYESAKLIANRLHRSVRTIEAHLDNVKQKLNKQLSSVIIQIRSNIYRLNQGNLIA